MSLARHAPSSAPVRWSTWSRCCGGGGRCRSRGRDGVNVHRDDAQVGDGHGPHPVEDPALCGPLGLAHLGGEGASHAARSPCSTARSRDVHQFGERLDRRAGVLRSVPVVRRSGRRAGPAVAATCARPRRLTGCRRPVPSMRQAPAAGGQRGEHEPAARHPVMVTRDRAIPDRTGGSRRGSTDEPTAAWPDGGRARSAGRAGGPGRSGGAGRAADAGRARRWSTAVAPMPRLGAAV